MLFELFAKEGGSSHWVVPPQKVLPYRRNLKNRDLDGAKARFFRVSSVY